MTMLPIVAGPEPEFLTVNSPWIASWPLTVVVFVALMFHVMVLPASDPVFVSDHFALLESVTLVDAPVSEIPAVPCSAIELLAVVSVPPIEHAGNSRRIGRNRVTATI